MALDGTDEDGASLGSVSVASRRTERGTHRAGLLVRTGAARVRGTVGPVPGTCPNLHGTDFLTLLLGCFVCAASDSSKPWVSSISRGGKNKNRIVWVGPLCGVDSLAELSPFGTMVTATSVGMAAV